MASFEGTPGTLYCRDCVWPQESVTCPPAQPPGPQNNLAKFTQLQESRTREREGELVTPVAFCEQFKAEELFKALICQCPGSEATGHYHSISP